MNGLRFNIALLFGCFQQEGYGIEFLAGDSVPGCALGFSFPFTQFP